MHLVHLIFGKLLIFTNKNYLDKADILISQGDFVDKIRFEGSVNLR